MTTFALIHGSGDGGWARHLVHQALQDRFIPSQVQRRVAADRLGIVEVDEIDAGHCANLGRPDEPAAILAGHVQGHKWNVFHNGQ